MTDGPNIWNVDESIPFEIFVADPTDGSGLTGQVANITFSIQRFSDNNYWTGAAWSAIVNTVTVTEADSVNQPGRYTFTLSAIGNDQVDKYIAHVVVDNPPAIDGAENYELHVSRNLDLRLYESEPVR